MRRLGLIGVVSGPLASGTIWQPKTSISFVRRYLETSFQANLSQSGVNSAQMVSYRNQAQIYENRELSYFILQKAYEP